MTVGADGDAAPFAVVICDMWNAHHCVSAADRVAALVPRMNEVVRRLREKGATIIHAPSGCMDFYRDLPQRRRALDAPVARAPIEFDWRGWDQEPDPGLPASIVDPGPCSCESPEPCCDGSPPYPWYRQIESLEIAPGDSVTDDGQEVFNLLEANGIDDVVMLGVHTNICVMGRPFGIRQLARAGKRPILCRDLTDSFHRDPRGHAWGTARIVEYIEREWCPVTTSDELLALRWGSPSGVKT